MASNSTGNTTIGGGRFETQNLFMGGTSTTDGGVGSLSLNGNYGRLYVGNDLANHSTSQPIVSIGDTNLNNGGRLFIRNGSSLNSGIGYVGFSNNYSGDVTVTGSNSIWDSNSTLYFGYNGSADLTVADGGSVSAVKPIYRNLF